MLRRTDGLWFLAARFMGISLYPGNIDLLAYLLCSRFSARDSVLAIQIQLTAYPIFTSNPQRRTSTRRFRELVHRFEIGKAGRSSAGGANRDEVRFVAASPVW